MKLRVYKLVACCRRCFALVRSFILFLRPAAVTNERLHKLADLTKAAEFEGFRDPDRDPPVSQAAPEPFLRNRLRSRAQFWALNWRLFFRDGDHHHRLYAALDSWTSVDSCFLPEPFLGHGAL